VPVGDAVCIGSKQRAPYRKTLAPVLVPEVGVLKCMVKGIQGDGPGGWVLPNSALADCEGKLMIDVKEAFVRLAGGVGCELRSLGRVRAAAHGGCAPNLAGVREALHESTTLEGGRATVCDTDFCCALCASLLFQRYAMTPLRV